MGLMSTYSCNRVKGSRAGAWLEVLSTCRTYPQKKVSEPQNHVCWKKPLVLPPVQSRLN